MKYNESNPPIKCFMTQSTWYKGAGTMVPKGVLFHSTGANNPSLKRYVQPDDNAPNKEELLKIIGVNNSKNDWNHIYREAGVNAWVGKLANGEVSTVQAGPWNKKPWGCGSGSKGSCNNGWVQFEIAEDSLTDANYFNQIYKEACEITAYICKMYNIDPHGTVKLNGVTVPTILCHQDSYRLGLGGNHADVLHWFPKFGKSMETVRNDVAILLQEDDDMTQEKFNEMFAVAMNAYRKSLQDNDSGAWSDSDKSWAINQGLMQGSGKTADGENNYMWQDFLTREQAAALFHRFAESRGFE